MNELADTMEFYCGEYKRLKEKYEPGSGADLHGWQQQRQSKIAQLESLNAELERMVSELEHDRRYGIHCRHIRSTCAMRCCIGIIEENAAVASVDLSRLVLCVLQEPCP